MDGLSGLVERPQGNPLIWVPLPTASPSGEEKNDINRTQAKCRDQTPAGSRSGLASTREPDAVCPMTRGIRYQVEKVCKRCKPYCVSVVLSERCIISFAGGRGLGYRWRAVAATETRPGNNLNTAHGGADWRQRCRRHAHRQPSHTTWPWSTCRATAENIAIIGNKKVGTIAMGSCQVGGICTDEA
ncbi:hypothetical protein QBC35DRAFT_469168 [Podospora australis]|uniref:Uncharacterized protein n=1 Tax=Podospora australis TaxID=1536484 RepID=A0AAN7ALU8_9PEZI|nr:hypothetical protein QBC35DRAFT_469168 [Podospora australis]